MIDSHIHLEQFDTEDINTILNKLDDGKLDSVIAVSMNLDSAVKLLRLKQQAPAIQIAAGFHPEQELPDDEELGALEQWLTEHHESLSAIGEVGLPHYLNRAGKVHDMSRYVYLLERMIIIAKRYDLPVVLHAVYEDAGTAVDLLQKHGVTRAHFHWFKASDDVIRLVIQSGYMVSVTPDVLWNDKTRRVLTAAPLSQLMFETDGPWPHAGFEATDIPGMLSVIIDEIAVIKQLEPAIVREVVTRNTVLFYGNEVINENR
ncbi:TatD family deoxyribonuclease [Macrococcus equipercicus]|uniref:TatD family deoxyribonuclease n=1 Tax=Macrococcus equipercicus TaxID=69967 RepID=A0ABQ6RB21_9STAP|nr:TatD family hydrolase [Macrococcus equipercicus]KAA1042381.1 TatD family deoxyribonuclease [Macrococcus equipercicus]